MKFVRLETFDWVNPYYNLSQGYIYTFKMVCKQTVDSNARQSCKVPKESLMAAIRNSDMANRSFETVSGESK